MYSRDVNAKLHSGIGKQHFAGRFDRNTMTGPKYRKSPAAQVLKGINKKLHAQNYEAYQRTYPSNSCGIKPFPSANIDEHIQNVQNKLEYLERYA